MNVSMNVRNMLLEFRCVTALMLNVIRMMVIDSPFSAVAHRFKRLAINKKLHALCGSQGVSLQYVRVSR